MNAKQPSDQQALALLMAADCPEKFYPENFDFEGEHQHALAFARHLEQSLGTVVILEDPSLNQDGPLFLRMLLINKIHLGKTGDIYISSFGRLATIGDPALHEMNKIIRAMEENRYAYVPWAYLERPYEGGYEVFAGKSWFYRFFVSYYY